MEKMKVFARLLVLSAGAFCVVSCGGGGGGESATSSVISSTPTIKYTVRFNSCGGSAVSSKLVEEGGVIRTAPTSTRDGYSFEAWCLEYNGAQGKEGTEVEFPLTVTGNMMLYARWTQAVPASHTEEEINEYLDSLKDTSEANHVYFHYYRFKNTAESYDDWDIWCWPYRPKEGEGARFDWKGRQTPEPKTDPGIGSAIIDDFGGAVADIDLTKTYDGGAKNNGKTIGGTQVSFYQKDGVTLDTQIGVQVVKTSSRPKPEGKFWTNDGGDLHIDLTNPEEAYEVTTKDGGKAWHVFSLQEKVASYGSKVITDMSDPFVGDKGDKVTRGKAIYNDVDWNSTAQIQNTAPSFASGVGVGYQIQVASFADSDGDGFGDIYGITSKLGYLEKLGVKALWLTPVQKSDSYHGYDISDYQAVDVKFGSSVSTAALANNGKVTPETAMADYQELIDKAHAKGIKIIMDLVLNHTSTSNKWFIGSAQLNDTYRGYYQWGNNDGVTDPVIKEANCWFPYGEHLYSYYAKFGSSMPELNYQYKATRKAVEDMSLYWCGKGVDGFRLDAVKHVFMTDEVLSGNNDTLIMDKAEKGDYSSNLTKNLHFYKELNAVVKAKYPNAFFVGENFDGHAYHVSPWYEAFDSMFDFYGYFNLTSAAAHAHGNYTAGPTFGTMMTKQDLFKKDGSINDKAGVYNGVSGQYKWNLVDVLASYNRYRSKGKALPGFFTSNHDIARVINRCAGTTGNADGLDEQGNIADNKYYEYRKLSDCVKAAEILMPGLTWIYYGDEIGMTGNFPAKDRTGADFSSKSDYADLWWRQPMKWTQGGKVGDGSMTTGFSITGSDATIVWDSINASSKVSPANTQVNSAESEFGKLAQIIAYKNNNPGMITGTIADLGSDTENLKFSNGNVQVYINFKNYTVYATGGSGTLDFKF